jgi:type IV pilus assembly protein PilA
MKKAVKNNKGFSLVELIVVIAIMAVLVGVLAPQFIKYVEKSREATDIQNISSIADACQTYFADHTGTGTSVTITLGSAVTDTDGLAVLVNAGLATAGDSSATVALKGSWTTAPTVTYTIATSKVEFSGASQYYDPEADGSGYVAK